jgi:hypothetical protein
MIKLLFTSLLFIVFMNIHAQDTKAILKEYLIKNNPALEIQQVKILDESKKYESYDVEDAMNVAITAFTKGSILAIRASCDNYEKLIDYSSRPGIDIMKSINKMTADIIELEEQFIKMKERSNKPLSIVTFNYVYLNKNVNKVEDNNAHVLISENEIIFFY